MKYQELIEASTAPISTTRNPRFRYYSSEGIDSPGHAPIQFVINPTTVSYKHKIVPHDWSNHNTRSEAEEKIISDELPIKHVVGMQVFPVPKDFEPNQNDEEFLSENGGYYRAYQMIIKLAKQCGIRVQDFRRRKKRT